MNAQSIATKAQQAGFQVAQYRGQFEISLTNRAVDTYEVSNALGVARNRFERVGDVVVVKG